MKLRNKVAKRYPEGIMAESLKKCLFRFLKEFNLYSEYVKFIKKRLGYKSRESKNGLVAYYFSYSDFLRYGRYAINRSTFPPCSKNVNWDYIFDCWREWAAVEDNIGNNTIVI